MSSRLLLKQQRHTNKKQGTYFEGHHIIPKAKGGTGTSSKGLNHPNIVLLTAREHFLAHWLLWRIYKDRSSALAFHKMMSTNDHQTRTKSSRGYEEARLAFSETNKGNQYGRGQIKVISEEQKRKQSEIMRGRYSGESNPFYGKKHSVETVNKLRKPKSAEHVEKIKQRMISRSKVTCHHCNKEVDQLNAKRWHFDNCKMRQGTIGLADRNKHFNEYYNLLK
jgi:hypothetical protein